MAIAGFLLCATMLVATLPSEAEVLHGVAVPIPSLLTIDYEVFNFAGFITPLTEEDFECKKTYSLYYKPDGKCYYLFQQGPCGEDEMLVFNKDQAVNASSTERLICQSRFLCPDGQRFMSKDQKCHDLAEVKDTICDKGLFVQNLYGEGQCSCLFDSDNNGEQDVCSRYYTHGPCSLLSADGFRGEIQIRNDTSECKIYELDKNTPCSEYDTTYEIDFSNQYLGFAVKRFHYKC